jgi:hypothetical protein
VDFRVSSKTFQKIHRKKPKTEYHPTKIHKVSLHPLSQKKKDLFAKRKFSGQKIYLKNKRQKYGIGGVREAAIFIPVWFDGVSGEDFIGPELEREL